MLIREVEEFSQTELISIIKNECSQFLSGLDSYEALLYRGTYNNDSWIKKSSPVNRKPVDSERYAQNTFDKLLKQVGATALRSNSFFCTTDKLDADNFGSSTYYVIPVNGFSFTRVKNSPHDTVDFSLGTLIKMGPKTIKNLINYFREEIKKETDKKNKKYLEKTYKDLNNIDERRKSMRVLYHEFMGIMHARTKEKVLSSIIDVQEFKKRYEIEYTDLKKVMVPLGHEIMIHGEVYAMQVKLFEDEHEFRKTFV